MVIGGEVYSFKSGSLQCPCRYRKLQRLTEPCHCGS